LELAWVDSHSLCVLAQTAKEYVLRKLELPAGEFSVYEVPPAFRRFRPGHDTVQFSLAPNATALSALEPAAGPLGPAKLMLLRATGNVFNSVDLRGLPADFYVDSVGWGAPGQLFLAARPYLSPNQSFSVGKIDPETGAFCGVVPKESVDLIDRLTVLPNRGLLLLRCRGFRGEYPQEPVLAGWDMTTGQSLLLHSRARQLETMALDDSQAIAVRGDERWILRRNETPTTLKPSASEHGAEPVGCPHALDTIKALT